MVIVKIQTFKVSYEEFIPSFKNREDLEKIRRTNWEAILPVKKKITNPLKISQYVLSRL
jgi:hypothetical protein